MLDVLHSDCTQKHEEKTHFNEKKYKSPSDNDPVIVDDQVLSTDVETLNYSTLKLLTDSLLLHVTVPVGII